MCRWPISRPGTARKVEVDGRPVALVRIGDDVYAIGDTCSHANVSLSEGEVLADEREIECWKHGSTFSLVTGEPQTLPATQPVPVYDVRVEDGRDRGGGRMTTLRDRRACGPRAGGTEILHGIDLTVSSGEVHAVMGPNGAGKSTLSGVVMGKPGYEVLGGSVTLDGRDVLAMAPYERAVAGLYLAMQYPTEVPGVRLDAVLAEALAGPGPGHRRPAEPAARRGRAHRLRRAVPRAAAQRRPLGRREEAQRDAAAGRAGAPASPSSTSWTPAWTWTRSGPAPAGSRRRRTRTASACWPSPTTTGCCTS